MARATGHAPTLNGQPAARLSATTVMCSNAGRLDAPTPSPSAELGSVPKACVTQWTGGFWGVAVDPQGRYHYP